MDRIVNRIKLIKLYSDPEVFDPILFHDGVNIILGERYDNNTKQGRKTNGVGKSMSVEFLNFCLLKRYNASRVSRIPDDYVGQDTDVMLDFKIGEKELTIIRNKRNSDKPSIIRDGKRIEFDKLEDAIAYLSDLTYNRDSIERTPSFRELISLLIRDEKSEFSNILRPHNISDRNIPIDYKPHLFLLNIQLNAYIKTQETVAKIETIKKVIKKLKNDLTDGKLRKLSDVKVELNSLDDEVKKMSIAIDNLKTNDAFESIEQDLLELEDLLDKYRVRQKLLKYELAKIQSLPKPEVIENDEVKVLFNKYKEGLGDSIVKSLDETIAFKNKIESFQKNLQSIRAIEIEEDLMSVTETIRELDDEYSEKLSIIDQKGVLKNLKASISVYNQKNTEYSRKKGLYEEYVKGEKSKKALLLQKSQQLLELDNILDENNKVFNDFLNTMSTIHEAIMGNKECSFEVYTVSNNTSKKTVDVEMRIYDDGSHSVDRTKTFIYDMSLLFNQYSSVRHPLFLIHDNIFDVDQDTLVQSLNFLNKQEEKYIDFQYILTLNRDKIEHEERLKYINMNIDAHKVATFTKENKFLKFDYQEI